MHPIDADVAPAGTSASNAAASSHDAMRKIIERASSPLIRHKRVGRYMPDLTKFRVATHPAVAGAASGKNGIATSINFPSARRIV